MPERDYWEETKNLFRKKAENHRWWHGFDYGTFFLMYTEIIEKLPAEDVKKMLEVKKKASKWERIWHGDRVFQRAINAIKEE